MQAGVFRTPHLRSARGFALVWHLLYFGIPAAAIDIPFSQKYITATPEAQTIAFSYVGMLPRWYHSFRGKHCRRSDFYQAPRP
jgi:hypothetical protein